MISIPRYLMCLVSELIKAFRKSMYPVLTGLSKHRTTEQEQGPNKRDPTKEGLLKEERGRPSQWLKRL